MKLDWDYSALARTYDRRPNYSQPLIEEILRLVAANQQTTVCDIGAGTGYLAKMLAPHVQSIAAVEPNANMRTVGISHCQRISNLQWFDTRGEATGLPTSSFDVITFGSSFNVVDQEKALVEASRICKSGGWFLAIWNHRNLDAPLQKKVESYIKSVIPGYRYGTRRQDQTARLEQSNLFNQVTRLEKAMTVEQSSEDAIAAWRSHATLQRQAGEKHSDIINGISAIINSQYQASLLTPYVSRAWLAQFK